MTLKKRAAWTTRLGFYLVAIGSACGLGNLWRFPYVVAENGGGAFVLLYLTLAFTVGLPLLIAELMLGKTMRVSIMTATTRLSEQAAIQQKRFIWLGRISVVLALVVLSYYAVVSGWVLHFVVQFLFGIFRAGQVNPENLLATLMSNGLLQVGLASVHLLFAWLVVMKGVQEGLEKWIGAMMPIFIVLLILLMFKSLSLPTTEPAMRFLLYPDFSRLTPSALVSALGHVFFTLSVGFGTMVTFGSYMNDQDHVPSAGLRVTFADTAISLLAGALVFPIVLQASQLRLIDPTLLFEALPRFLAQTRGGLVFGLTFFLCLYLAALAASIGLFEVIVSNFVDVAKNSGYPVGRRFASKVTGVLAFGLAMVPALSSTFLSQVRFGGRGILETLDTVLINWILPLVALGMSLMMSTLFSETDKNKEFLDPRHRNTYALYGHWKFALKYYIPGLVILGLTLNLFW